MAAKRKPHFIQNAIQNPGYLHRALHVPQDQTIPVARVEAAAKQTKNPHLEHAAQMALRMRHMNPGTKKGK